MRTKIINGELKGGAGILACVNGRVKEVAVSETHEIARVAYLGQVTNIGSGRARKLLKERSREGHVITVRDLASEKDYHL